MAPGWIRSGFTGVDVFFVISGFLISTIIFGNLERNSFSFVEFYVRRIKRIFPALLVVLIACYALGWFALLADEYKQLGKHIAGGAGFVSNFVLWGESGYFTNAESRPLLHLWSLGIEEQFYIVWPLLMVLAWKQRMNLLTMTICIVLISFALNIGLSNTDTVAAFYSPATRFWELLAGSGLAYLALNKQSWLTSFRDRYSTLGSFTGAGLIAVGFFAIDRTSSFPGWWAVLPTAGTVLLISAGAQAWLNRAVLAVISR